MNRGYNVWIEINERLRYMEKRYYTGLNVCYGILDGSKPGTLNYSNFYVDILERDILDL